MSRFMLQEKIEKGHYLIRVRDIPHTLEEQREHGKPHFRQEVEVYDQSKKPPLLIASWPGPEVVRALFKPTGRPMVARAKLKAKDDDTSGFEAMERDAKLQMRAAVREWKAGGPCPMCERPYDGSLVGDEPCEFCDMPTKPASSPEEEKPGESPE